MLKQDIILIVFLTIIILTGIVFLIIAFCIPDHENQPDTIHENEKNHSFITFSELGNHGRLGNQLFQIAATVGIGHEFGKKIILPDSWSYRNMFQINDSPKLSFENVDQIKHNTIRITEQKCFLFDDSNLAENHYKNIDLYGFRQNIGYFMNTVPELRDILEFNPELVETIKTRIPDNSICIHVRRGDYVEKPAQKKAHEICTLAYYIKSVEFFTSRFPNSHVFVVSDDKKWCVENLPKNYNYFNGESEIEDFISLSLCRFKVISNSTFGWWAAWLDARHDSEVMAPSPWIRDQDDDFKYLYNENWHVYDILSNQIKLSKWDFNVKIGGYYQCFRQPKAFLHSVHSFRRVYPTSSLVIVNDDGDNYIHVAKRYNAKYFVNASRGGNGTTTTSTSISYAFECIKNFIMGAKEMSEEYFTLLEDDTCVLRPIQCDVNKQIKNKFAIIANAESPMPSKIRIFLKKNYKRDEPVYIGNGGCLFLSSFWSKLDLNNVKKLVQEFSSLINGFFFDVLLTFICVANGGKIAGKNKQQIELSEYRSRLGEIKSPGILHIFKDLYNTSLSSHEKTLLRPILTEKNPNYFKVAIIGPGLMPIPPSGWGAVEILIWNYAKELQKLGHVVLIVNDADPQKILEQLQDFCPHFVHIQYDDFAYLAHDITKITQIVGISSHFGYIEQPDRWGSSYKKIATDFISMMEKNTSVYNFALSQGISQFFSNNYGMTRTVVNPNGADNNAFHYHPIPKYKNRTICVGKIEPRKQQANLQHNKSIWFAGNKCGVEFNYDSVNYLGEWSKPTLYENLTDYGNLVLLSDGEADPLVIKEALVAGLGIVINRWSIANLDISRKFITVIPDDKLKDKNFIDQAIDTNRQYAVVNRHEIRAYSKKFWWENLVPKYVENIKSLIVSKKAEYRTTIVSAYFKIPSKTSHDKYLPLIETFLKNVRQHCIFFTSVSLLSRFNLVASSFVEFHVFDFQKNFDTNSDFWNRQIERDSEKYHTAQLGYLWSLKKSFVMYAAQLTRHQWQDPVNHNYIWCDAGCIRDKVLETAMIDFGNRFYLKDNLLHISKVYSQSPTIQETIENQIYYKFPTAQISCAIMFGKETSWKKIDEICNNMLSKYDENKIPATSDQYVLLSCINAFPEFFLVHDLKTTDENELGWFRFIMDI